MAHAVSILSDPLLAANIMSSHLLNDVSILSKKGLEKLRFPEI
jgi:hypothetical protein